MSQFLLESFRQYKERMRADRRFDTDCKRIREILEHSNLDNDELFIQILTPMIEVSWVDGRIGRYEQDAILHAGDRYGLFGKEANFFVVMDRLSTRPTAKDHERWWDEINSELRVLPLPETAAIASHLLEQTKYIAGLGQKQLFGLWRGHNAGPDEVLVLKGAEKRIKALEQRSAANDNNDLESDQLLKLVPLVEVAWADGRISKRERKLILDSFFDLGIRPTNDNIQRLLSWLKVSPSGDFLTRSLARLKKRFESLSEDDRANEKYSLISQCTLVAEASGGTSDFEGGGARICDEEIIAVKRIASILNGALDRGKTLKGGK